MNVGRKYQYSGRMYQSSLEDSGVVETVMAKLLRVLLNVQYHGTAHYMLKKLVNEGGDVQRMHKGVFEVALATLVDRGLVCWHGVGNWAQYTIPGHRKNDAIKMAFADFGGEVDVDSVLSGGCDQSDQSDAVVLSSRRGQKRGKARSSDSNDIFNIGKRIRRVRGQQQHAMSGCKGSSESHGGDPMSP